MRGCHQKVRTTNGLNETSEHLIPGVFRDAGLKVMLGRMQRDHKMTSISKKSVRASIFSNFSSPNAFRHIQMRKAKYLQASALQMRSRVRVTILLDASHLGLTVEQ